MAEEIPAAAQEPGRSFDAARPGEGGRRQTQRPDRESALGTGDSTPNHQAVFASIETKSPWPPLVRFMYDVQQPESFVVFESVNLQIDSADPTMMRGKFKIARWFAPKAGQTTPAR